MNDKFTNVDVEIIQFFIDNPAPTYPANIAKEINRNKTGVGKRCKELKENKILDSNTKYSKINGLIDYYELNKSIETLIKLCDILTTDYLSELMRTSYYLDMIDEIIEFFNNNLETKLLDIDIEILKIYLKYTPTGLKYILSKNYNQNFDLLKILIFEDLSYIKFGGTILYNAIKLNFGKRFLQQKNIVDSAHSSFEKGINKLKNDHFEDYKFVYLFQYFTLTDYYSNNIKSVGLIDDYYKIKELYKQKTLKLNLYDLHPDQKKILSELYDHLNI